MISKNLINFLETLKENNTREWFNANKAWYNEVKVEFESFTSKMITVVGNIDKEVAYLEPKDCLFRIYRDTRFSNDKTPYKTNMGSYVVKGGRNSGYAGYYFHIEPGVSFLAGGIYMPMPDVLKKLRTAIYENIDEFLEIINNSVFIKHFGKIEDDAKLKTPPKGFPKEFEHIEYLKFKNYSVLKNVPVKLIHSEKLFEEMKEVFIVLKPLIHFLNQAISEE